MSANEEADRLTKDQLSLIQGTPGKSPNGLPEVAQEMKEVGSPNQAKYLRIVRKSNEIKKLIYSVTEIINVLE